MISQLVLARDDRDALVTDEIIGTCILLLFAGHETTTNLIGNGFLYSMSNREQWERLVADPSLADTRSRNTCATTARRARWRGSPPPTSRWRQDDPRGPARLCLHELGQPRPRGVRRPERFDIGRAQNPHMTFGHGIHFCLGAPLAPARSRASPPTRLAERLPASA
jgi:cytochrome P450